MLGVPGFVKHRLIIGLPADRTDHQFDFVGNGNRRTKGPWAFARPVLAVNQDVLLDFCVDAQPLHRLLVDRQ